jgi:hypothetical protein
MRRENETCRCYISSQDRDCGLPSGIKRTSLLKDLREREGRPGKYHVPFLFSKIGANKVVEGKLDRLLRGDRRTAVWRQRGLRRCYSVGSAFYNKRTQNQSNNCQKLWGPKRRQETAQNRSQRS